MNLTLYVWRFLKMNWKEKWDNDTKMNQMPLIEHKGPSTWSVDHTIFFAGSLVLYVCTSFINFIFIVIPNDSSRLRD